MGGKLHFSELIIARGFVCKHQFMRSLHFPFHRCSLISYSELMLSYNGGQKTLASEKVTVYLHGKLSKKYVKYVDNQ
jgi:hypothetical protein